MHTRRSLGSMLLDIIIYGVLIGFAVMTVVPLLYIIAGSFTDGTELVKNKLVLIPTHFSLDGYTFILKTPDIPRSLLVTIYITIVGTVINLLFTSLLAYPLARKDLRERRVILFFILFTMLFSGGIIPSFLVVKSLGLIDSLWSQMIPNAISAFNLIVLRNFFMQLPESLEESAKIDGYNDLSIMFRIVLPLSLPALATFGLFYAVEHWNTFFSALLYLNDAHQWPIQVWLRQIILLSQGGLDTGNLGQDFVVPPSQTIKMAVIVISTLPILCVYPFLQKHFAQGILLGSVKG
ncbi:carbohydrate ABC transporter permease [Paenibacillus oryzisoli]|uniref:carbohydrate ABC transporter permease n=1 Tax=Paenibacillus oryzisoli TaxID=1850517 RepID=UPI003D2C2C44